MADAIFSPSTDIGKVRALIPDIYQFPNLMQAGVSSYCFTDQMLQAFLDLNGGNIRLATADALEILGTNEMMVGKVITTQDLVTDTSKLMAQYLARAKGIRERELALVALEDGDISPVTIVTPFYNDHDLGSYPYEGISVIVVGDLVEDSDDPGYAHEAI